MDKRLTFAISLLLTAIFAISCTVTEKNPNQPELQTDTVPEGDTMQSDEPVTIRNELFVLHIPAGKPYHRDIEDKIRAYCRWVVTDPALDLFPKPHISPIIFTNDGGPQRANDSEIYLSDADYLFESPAAPIPYLHELTHLMQLRTVYIDSVPFVEGYAVWNMITALRLQNLPVDTKSGHGLNYSFENDEQEQAMLDADMEMYFRTGAQEREAEVTDYLYGFRFCVYLEDVYGEGFLAKLILGHRDHVEQMEQVPQNAFVDFLIKQTEKTVFTGFRGWYLQNAEIFEDIT